MDEEEDLEGAFAASAEPEEAPVKMETDGDDAAEGADGEALEEGYVMKQQTGYLYFCSKHRAEVTASLAEEFSDKGEQNKQVMKRLGALWSKCSDEEKAKCKQDAPMVKQKIRKKKEKKRKADEVEEDDAPPPAAASKPIDMAELRNLKALHDEGVLTDQEFSEKKAQILGLASAAGAAAPPPAPPAAASSSGKTKEGKKPRLELSTAALEPFMKETCSVRQENPKRDGSKSAEMYDKYKEGTTFEEMLSLGARKADVANDFAKGFVVLDDADQQARLMDQCKPAVPKPKKAKEAKAEGDAGGDDAAARASTASGDSKKSSGATKLDAAFLRLCGRYYVRRCANEPDEGLVDGYEGPASYANATGALLLTESPPGGGCLMRGIADPATAQLFAPKITCSNKAFKPVNDEYKFKLAQPLTDGLDQAAGKLTLKIAEAVDSRGHAILVGKYEFHAKRPLEELDSLWEENIKATRAPDDSPDWPAELFNTSA